MLPNKQFRNIRVHLCLSAALCLLYLTPTVASAQPNRDFFPWWDSPIVRDLQLSDDQTQQIRSIVREYRDQLIDLRGGVEKAENHLSDLINDEHPDKTQVNAAIENLITSRGNLTRAFTQMGFKLRMVLTPPQWRELQRRRPRPPNNPNGPNPRPPRQPGEQGSLQPGPDPPDRGDFQNPRPRVFHGPDQGRDDLPHRDQP
jgi:Spy/CpxP family protein refolding chaperone